VGVFGVEFEVCEPTQWADTTIAAVSQQRARRIALASVTRYATLLETTVRPSDASPRSRGKIMPRPTETASLDRSLEVLEEHARRWARLDLEAKIAMAERLMSRIHETAPRQVEAALEAKALSPGEPAAGEEWLAGPMAVLRTLRLLVDSLRDVAERGAPRLPRGSVDTREDGTVTVRVFPRETWDRLLFSGFEAEVWMQPEVTVDNLEDHMASFYDRDDPEGRVALVLGAGNVASIPPLDAIYKLFVEGQVVLLKMNPVNEYLGPFLEEAFSEFVERGFFDVVYGGAEVGDYLCHHEAVDEIHITGSDRTHDAIVFGTGEEGEARKARGERRLSDDKRITSELGNVSPVIVVPGPWSDSELQFQAENLATQLANNAGFNCNAVRVILTHAGWDRRDAFLDALRSTLADLPQRHPYYPGAHERFETFASAHRDRIETFGVHDDERLPWGLIVGVDTDRPDDIVFTRESWCSMTAEAPLEARDVADFLERAAAFCNEHVWGTLNASILVHPETEEEHAAALDRAITELEYGTIVVNHWAGIGYALGMTPWGAHPGHTYEDIQSGIGVVHNTYMFDAPRKTIIRGPFEVFPKPPWFATNRQTHQIGPRLTDFEYRPGVRNFLRVVSRAVRG
jgi:hypothetical protein